jgi:hypothetical protein
VQSLLGVTRDGVRAVSKRDLIEGLLIVCGEQLSRELP